MKAMGKVEELEIQRKELKEANAKIILQGKQRQEKKRRRRRRKVWLWWNWWSKRRKKVNLSVDRSKQQEMIWIELKIGRHFIKNGKQREEERQKRRRKEKAWQRIETVRFLIRCFSAVRSEASKFGATFEAKLLFFNILYHM